MAQVKNTKYYITSAIGILIMLFFGKLPALGVMSELGMQLLGIYLGAIFLWATTDLVWPSLLAIFLIGCTDYTGITEALSSGFGNSTVIFIWLMYMFAAIIHASGISGHIAKGICSVKFAKGKPWVITFLFMLASYVVALTTNVSGGIVICWAIFSQYAKGIGYKKGEAWPVYTMTGMAIIGMAGSVGLPYRAPANIFVGYAKDLGFETNFIQYFVAIFLFTAIVTVLYLVVGKYVLKIDASKCKNEYDYGDNEKLSGYQKAIIVIFCLLVLLFLLKSLVSASSAIGQFLNKIGDCGLVLLLLIPMAVIHRKGTNKPFGDLISSTKNGVVWPVFYLMILNLPMGAIINNPDLGIAASAKLLLDPIFGGSNGALLFIICTVLVSVLVTIFIGNVPAITICWAVTSVYAPTLGVNIALLAWMCSILGTCVVMLPCSNPVAAMLHGQNEWVESKDVVKHAGLGAVYAFVAGIIVFAIFHSVM